MPTTKTKTDAAWRAVHRAADANVARFRDPFVASVEALRRRVSLAELEESVRAGTPTRALVDAIDAVKVAKIAADPADLATKVYAQTIVDAVQGQAAYVESVWGTGGASIVGRFNVVSPFVLRAAETLTADLIREVSAESKDAVRRVIFNAVRDGVAPRDAAMQIRDILGLTTRQALAVNRLEQGLLTQGAEPAFARAQGKRYSERLLRDRAENIARTETMLASNRGQQLLWGEMQNAGVVGQDFGQRWLVTPDDRLCPRCAPMQGQVVQLGYLFRETENGVLPSKRTPVAGANVLSPPLHPRCRCTLVFDDDIDRLPDTQEDSEPTAEPVPEWITTNYATLDPSKKTTLKEEIAARKTPEGASLQRGIRKFSEDTDEAQDIREAGERLVNGATAQTDNEKSALRMLQAIGHGPARKGALHRGMGLTEDADTLLARYAKGSEFDLGLSSFSSSEQVARGFAEEYAFKGTQVMVRTDGPVRALPAQKISAEPQEKEWITSGRFRVKDAKLVDGVVHIRIEQVDAFESVISLAKAARTFDRLLAGSFAEQRRRS